MVILTVKTGELRSRIPGSGKFLLWNADNRSIREKILTFFGGCIFQF